MTDFDAFLETFKNCPVVQGDGLVPAVSRASPYVLANEDCVYVLRHCYIVAPLCLFMRPAMDMLAHTVKEYFRYESFQ